MGWVVVFVVAGAIFAMRAPPELVIIGGLVFGVVQYWLVMKKGGT